MLLFIRSYSDELEFQHREKRATIQIMTINHVKFTLEGTRC